MMNLFNNFYKMYSEINGATLTGAIDVVVVEQENGSYACSPFHVRFGKIGVLRSREKVVDIEVNGEPVDIHMKLGESGEAFFVEEVADDDEEEVPANLATSPIPTNPYLFDDDNSKFSPIAAPINEKYQIPKPRRNSIDLAEQNNESAAGTALGQEEVTEKRYENQVSDYSHRRYTDTIQRTAKMEYTTQRLRKEWAEHDVKLYSGGEKSKDDLPGDVVASTGDDGEANKAATEEATNGVADEEVVVQADDDQSCTPKAEDASVKEDSKSKKKRRKKSIMKKKNSQRKNSSSSSNGSHCEQMEGETVDSLSSSQQTIGNASSSTDNTPNQVKEFVPVVKAATEETQPIKEEPFKPICVAPPTPDSARIRNLDHHCFSDTDAVNAASPSTSRPATPIQSDTEFEMNQRAQKDNVGMTHSASWKWGELPTKEGEDTADDKQSQRNSMLTGVFSFMRQSNKIRSTAPEGLYLSDLDAEGMDPEVAALYFPNHSMDVQLPRPQPIQMDSKSHHDANNTTDDDRESGNGTSLPQSPCSNSDLDDGVPGKEKYFNFIAISTCGGLDQPGGPTKEEFDSQMVTYSEVCRNPALFSSPNIVVRLNNKYYTWAAACPIVMTMLTFRKPLPVSTIDQLLGSSGGAALKATQPEGRGFSWFNWRKSTDNKQDAPKSTPDDVKVTDAGEPVASAAVSTPVAMPTANVPQGTPGSDKTDATLKNDMNEATINAEAKVPSSVDKENGSEKPKEAPPTKEKYKKSLRLSAEQIASLNLKKGINEVQFSVTTAYQGTSRAMCYIFLWKYNDKVVISDVDGTITKSDVLGHLMPLVGKDWAQIGVAELYSKIEENGYKMLYLSARAIGQSRATREYLRSVRQGDVNLPDGPLLLNPTSLLSAFHREVIEKKPELFKIACLNDIKALFPKNPFYAGYGNRINDVWAYQAVGIPIERIFTINTKGELRHELTQTYQSSYCSMAYMADQLYPPVKDTDWTGVDDYSSFNFWREPVMEVDFEADGSIVVGGGSSVGGKPVPPPPPAAADGAQSLDNNNKSGGITVTTAAAGTPTVAAAGPLSPIPEN